MKLTYTHDAMVDLIIQDPTVTHSELAEVFSFSVGWIQRVVGSDSFQARLAQRKGDLVDPIIAHSLNSRLQGVAVQSLGLVQEKLAHPDVSAAYALDALSLAATGLGVNLPRAKSQ